MFGKSNTYKGEIRDLQRRYDEKRYGVFHTYILMVVLVGMYCYQFFVLGDGVQAYVTHTTDVFTGTFYTLITALFFHTGVVHLLGNLFGLFLFGRIAERHLGVRTYLVFLGGGVFANLVSNVVAHLLGQDYASLGASSGIAAVILFAMLLEPFRITTLIGWVLIGLDVLGVINPQSNTNHLAHLGGYLSLLVLYFFIERRHKKRVIKGLIINGVIVFIVYILLKINGLLFIG